MALEQLETTLWQMTPGPVDVHTHPRVYDAITPDRFVSLNEGKEGRSGLRQYTQVALASGLTVILAMPNEQVRLLDETAVFPERTVVEPYPIASLVAVRGIQAAISQEAYIPTGIYMGLDPEALYGDDKKPQLNTDLLHSEFSKVSEDCMALKVYLAKTHGGFNVPVEDGPAIISTWFDHNPEKPITLHVEGADVSRVLLEIASYRPEGKDMPIHIAHVSSRIELEAVIRAKAAGMNVTCEVTPHHLFIDDESGMPLGGYGCMKPSLKTKADVAFIWANIDKIDMFASDCAPHRRSDKEAASPAFGVANHTTMLPLLFGAVADGKLSMEQLYEKLCTNSRKRFNLPVDDGSSVVYSTDVDDLPLTVYEHRANAAYGYNPFLRPELKNRFHFMGYVVTAKAGRSYFDNGKFRLSNSRIHLLRPKNIEELARRECAND